MKSAQNIKQAAVYLFYSVLTTVVNWIAYSLFMTALKKIGAAGENANILTANTLSWIVAVAFSFIVNKIRVFRSESWEIKTVFPELARFFSTRFAVGLVEIILVPALAAIGLNRPLFGTEGMVSKIIVTPILIILNYLCGKFLVF